MYIIPRGDDEYSNLVSPSIRRNGNNGGTTATSSMPTTAQGSGFNQNDFVDEVVVVHNNNYGTVTGSSQTFNTKNISS